MMSYELRNALEPILELLDQIDGYLVFKGANGQEYILGRLEDILEEDSEESKEIQLSLPTVYPDGDKKARTAADELLDRINREIALFQLQQEDEDIEDLDFEQEPPKRIRFEPLRGDLPPELQE